MGWRVAPVLRRWCSEALVIHLGSGFMGDFFFLLYHLHVFNISFDCMFVHVYAFINSVTV